MMRMLCLLNMCLLDRYLMLRNAKALLWKVAINNWHSVLISKFLCVTML